MTDNELLCGACVQTGKLHFGVILGWSVVGSAAVWFVVSNLAGPGGGHMGGHERGTPGIYDCCCLLGYGLLPMLLHALISLLVPKCVSALGSYSAKSHSVSSKASASFMYA